VVDFLLVVCICPPSQLDIASRFGLLFLTQVVTFFNIIPYTGKGDSVEEGQAKWVVHSLTTGLGHKGHIVVCDNFFTSPLLLDSLL